MRKHLVTLIGAMLVIGMLAGCGNNPSEDGVALLKEEKYEEAAEKFQEAVDEEINQADAYRGLGMAKWELEDYEGAKEALAKALKEGGEKTAAIYSLLGNCEMQLGNPQAALNQYRLGLETEDCSKELKQGMRRNEIIAYEQLGDWESAKVKLQTYSTDYPDDAMAVKESEFLETR